MTDNNEILLMMRELSEHFIEEEDTFALLTNTTTATDITKDIAVLKNTSGAGGENNNNSNKESASSTSSSSSSYYLDFSLKSPLEKVISLIEYTLHEWFFDINDNEQDDDDSFNNNNNNNNNLKISKEIKHMLHFRHEDYEISYHWNRRTKKKGKTHSFDPALFSASTEKEINTKNNNNTLHRNLRQWFACGLDAFIVIEPKSYSRRFSDSDEASTLRSAVSVAMCSMGVYLPVFTPIDLYSNSIVGICFSQSLGTSCLYESNSISGSFASERCKFSTIASIFSSVRKQFMKQKANARTTVCYRIRIIGSISYYNKNKNEAFKSDEISDEDDIESDITPIEVNTSDSHAWDEDLIWSPWVSLTNPFDSISLDCSYERCLTHKEMISEGHSIFEEDDIQKANFYVVKMHSSSGEVNPNLKETSSLAELLHIIVSSELFVNRGENDALYKLASAYELESDEFWIDKLKCHPPLALPEALIDDILLDIFDDGSIDKLSTTADTVGHILKTTSKASSLLSRLSLHALVKFKNARAIAELWTNFMKELRFKYWERGEPFMQSRFDKDKEIEVDHSTCLLNQQIQLLNACIIRRRRRYVPPATEAASAKNPISITTTKMKTGDVWNEIDNNTNKSTVIWKADDDLDLNALLNDDSQLISSSSNITTTSVSEKFEDARQNLPIDENDGVPADAGVGIKRTLQMRLITPPHNFMNEPVTQMQPVYTEEQLLAIRDLEAETVEDDNNEQDRRQKRLTVSKELLMSDMSAFKAANPSAKLADFVRWHSPRDWITLNDNNEDDDLKGVLSQRMKEPGNTWERLFNETKPLQADEQKQLFDPITEGERVLHLLETCKFDFIMRNLIAVATNAVFCIFSASFKTEKLPMIDEKLQRCRDIASSIFQDLSAAKMEDFAQIAYEIQLIERAASRAASLRYHFSNRNNKSDDALNFIIERLFNDSLQNEYQNEERRMAAAPRNAAEEDDDETRESFKQLYPLCIIGKTDDDLERTSLLKSIDYRSKTKVASEVTLEEPKVFRIHVTNDRNNFLTRVSSIVF